jgi:PAS domain S-box-containing protein
MSKTDSGFRSRDVKSARALASRGRPGMYRARSASPLTPNQLTVISLEMDQGRLLQRLRSAGQSGVRLRSLGKQFRWSERHLADVLENLALRGLVRVNSGADRLTKITPIGKSVLESASRIPASIAESLAKRHSLGKIASEFSAEVTSSAPGHIDEIIKAKMRKVLAVTGVSRVCWYEWSKSGEFLERLYSVTRTGVPPSPPTVSVAEIPYTIDRLTQGEPLILRLKDSPWPGERDKKFLRDKCIDSAVLIPSNCGSEAKGILGLAPVLQSNWWTRDLLEQLAVLSNLIATAVERRIARHRLLESEQRFRYVFEEAPIGIALEGSDGGILYANPTLCSMLGYSPDELRGLRCAELTEPEDKKKEAVLFRQLMDESVDHYAMEKRFIRKDGSRAWGRVHVSLLKNVTGSPPLVIGMVEDVTERKKAAQELEVAQEELQRLTHRLIEVQDNERRLISRELHDDIGQRLALFGVDLDVLRRSLAKLGREREERQTASLLAQTQDLTSDVQQLSHKLHSSKLQHLGLRATLIELCNSISKVHRVTKSIANERFPEEVELCFYRVAQEALNNVMKHSKADRVSVSLSSQRGVARLEIKDTGVGFDSARSSNGIGLASMRERLRMIGGKVSVISAPGRGTEVKAEVPLMPPIVSSRPAA